MFCHGLGLMYSVSNCSQSSPLSDEDFIRDLDYKDFVADDSHTSKPIHVEGSRMISELLRQEFHRDYKLAPSQSIIKNTPRHEFPFNRHTVTIGIGNNVVDFGQALAVHQQIRARQQKFADEIEKVKEEMEKVRLLEQAWYEDYKAKKYVNDMTSKPRHSVSAMSSLEQRETNRNTKQVIESSVDQTSLSMIDQRETYVCLPRKDDYFSEDNDVKFECDTLKSRSAREVKSNVDLVPEMCPRISPYREKAVKSLPDICI